MGMLPHDPPPGETPDPAWLEIFHGYYLGRVEHSGDGLHGQAFSGFTIKLIYKFASQVTSAYKVATVSRDNFDRTSPWRRLIICDMALRKDVESIAYAISMWMALDRRYVQRHTRISFDVSC